MIVCKDFSHKAKAVAKSLGVELVKLESHKPVEYRNLKWVIALNPHLAVLSIPEFPDLTSEEIANGNLVCTCHGNEKRPLTEALNEKLRAHVFPDSNFRASLQKALSTTGRFCCQHEMRVTGRNLRIKGKGYKIDGKWVRFHIHATRKEANLDCQQYEMITDEKSTSMVHGQAELDGMKLDMLQIPGLNRMTISVAPCLEKRKP